MLYSSNYTPAQSLFFLLSLLSFFRSSSALRMKTKPDDQASKRKLLEEESETHSTDSDPCPSAAGRTQEEANKNTFQLFLDPNFNPPPPGGSFL